MNDFSDTDDFITDTVNTYSDTMYRVAFNITKNSEDALDVCQDVFVRRWNLSFMMSSAFDFFEKLL